MDPSLNDSFWLNPSLFQENKKRLSEIDPKLAEKISSHEPKQFLPCVTKKKEPNLFDQKTKQFFHNFEGAKEEAILWEKRCEYHVYPVVYVCGLGLGYFYSVFIPWLKKNPQHRLIFLEPSLDVITFFLHTSLAEEILENSQVSLFHYENAREFQDNVLFLYWRFYTDKIRVLLSPFDRNYRTSLSFTISYLLYDTHWKELGKMIEFFSPLQLFHQNFYENIFYYPKGSTAFGLFDKFKKIPAIVCGAGPSLEKQIPLLKKWQDYALVFAGGTSLNVLNAHGFWPHFGGGVDPNEEQYHRLLTNDSFSLPFFFDTRMNKKAAKLIQGSKIFLKGTGSSKVAEWFEKNLGIRGKEVEGANIGNICLTLAQEMGCDPIILIGFDLAYTEDLAYSEGVYQHPLFKEKKDPYFLQEEIEKTWVSDVKGNQVQTTWQWLLESNFISHLPLRYPKTTWINATEGGMPIQILEEKTLQEVIETHFKKRYELPAIVHGEIENHRIQDVTKQKILSFCIKWQKSLERCIEKIQNFLKYTEQDFFEKNLEQLQESLQEEEAYQNSLQAFDHVFLLTQIRQDGDWKRNKKKEEEKEHFKKKNLLRFEFLFRSSLIHLSILKKDVQNQIFFFSSSMKKDLSFQKIREIAPEEKVKEVYENGNKKITIDDQDTFRFYSEAGVLLTEVERKNGIPNGKTAFFYHSGQIAGEKTFQNGILEGVHTLYFEEGGVQASIPYQNGLLHGTVFLYSIQGKIFREIPYQENKREGIERFYDFNGSLLFEAGWKKGKAFQFAKEWYSSGELKKEILIQEDGNVFSFLWDQKGMLVKKIENEKEDYSPYFDEIIKQTKELEKSMETMTEEFENFLKTWKDHPSIKEWKQELEEIKKEIKILSKKKQKLIKREQDE